MCGGSERVVTSSCAFTGFYSRYYYCGEQGAGRREQDAGRRTGLNKVISGDFIAGKTQRKKVLITK